MQLFFIKNKVKIVLDFTEEKSIIVSRVERDHFRRENKMIYAILDEKGNVYNTFECPVKYFAETADWIESMYLSSVSPEFRGMKSFKKLQTFLFKSRNLWLVKEKAKEKNSVLVGRLTAGNDTNVFPLVDLSKVFGKEDYI